MHACVANMPSAWAGELQLASATPCVLLRTCFKLWQVHTCVQHRLGAWAGGIPQLASHMAVAHVSVCFHLWQVHACVQQVLSAWAAGVPQLTSTRFRKNRHKLGPDQSLGNASSPPSLNGSLVSGRLGRNHGSLSTDVRCLCMWFFAVVCRFL